MDSQSCPINSSQVDERRSRAVALIVLSLLVLFYFRGSFWLIVFIMADYFLRAFGDSRISPIGVLSGFILKKMKISPKPVNAAPKAFAARIGFGFSFCIALGAAINLYAFVSFLTVMLAVCTFLESVFGFCIGCKLYVLVHSLAKKNPAASGANGTGEHPK